MKLQGTSPYYIYFFNRDAKIAALEKTSAESERLMAEARSEKIRHMDELHLAQKKVADLESRYENLKNNSKNGYYM